MSAGLFSTLLERALRTAARRHRQHHRKASDLPYITHPVGVAQILVRAGFDDEHVLAAALLHDVVEDTDCTLDDLAAEFPEPVVRFVRDLTERKQDDQGRKRSWQERKDEHIRHVGTAPPEVRAIVLADKLHNLATMQLDLEQGVALWDRFGAPPEKVLWYHRTMVVQAEQQDPQLLTLADACREMITQLEALVPKT